MGKIDAAALEALVHVMNFAMQELDFSAEKEERNVRWLKANFIKHFTADVFFLNNHSEDCTFLHHHGNLIIRGMLEQLIEFLYLLKNSHRIEEYLGGTVNLEKVNSIQSLIEKAKLLMKKRYDNGRPSVYKMAENIGEVGSTEGTINLYGLYQLLSDESHNSYFSALLGDIHRVHHSTQSCGLRETQLIVVIIMIAIVLKEFNQAGQDNNSSANSEMHSFV